MSGVYRERERKVGKGLGVGRVIKLTSTVELIRAISTVLDVVTALVSGNTLAILTAKLVPLTRPRCFVRHIHTRTLMTQCRESRGGGGGGVGEC